MPETKSQEAEMSTSQSSSLTQQQVAVASEQPAPAPAATALNFLQALSGNPGLLSGATQEQGATNPQWAAATSMSQESLSSPVISQEQLLRLLQQTSGHERSGVQEEVNTNLTGVHNQAQVLSAIQSLGLQIHGPAEQPSMRVGSATSPSIRDQLLSLMQPREYQNLTNSNNASSASNQGQTSAILQQILNRSGATVENPVQRISQLLQGGQNVQNQILQLRQDPTPRPLSALEETLAVIQARGPISNASTQQLQNAVNLYLNLRGGNEVVATRQLLGQDLLHLLQHNSSSTQSVPTSSQTTREMLREAFLAQLNEASRTQQSQRPLSSDQQGILAAARQQQQQQPQQASEFNLSQLLSTNLHNQATQRAVAPPHDTNRVINASLESVLYHQAGRSQQGQVQQQQRQQRNSGSSDDKKPAALGPPTKKPRQE